MTDTKKRRFWLNPEAGFTEEIKPGPYKKVVGVLDPKEAKPDLLNQLREMSGVDLNSVPIEGGGQGIEVSVNHVVTSEANEKKK